MPDITLGPFTRQQAFDGIPFGRFGGSAGPQTIVIFAYVDNVEPEDCELCTIQEFPGSKFVTGAAGGSMVVTATLVNLGDDISYAVAGDGTITVLNGMFVEKIRSSVAVVNLETVVCSFTVQTVGHDIYNFSGPNLTEATTPPIKTNEEFNEETGEGEDTIQFSYSNTAAEDPTSFAVQRTGPDGTNIIGSVLRINGQTDYEFTDYSITEPGPYTYQIIPYKLSTLGLGPVSELAVDPDIANITDLSFAEDLDSIIILLSDPSGIYTLIEGKTHDTLYERTGVTHIEMAIPDPFGKSSFVP